MTIPIDVAIAALTLGLSAVHAWKFRDGTWAYMMAAFTGLVTLGYGIGAGFDRNAWLGFGTAATLTAIGYGMPKLNRARS